MKDFVVIPLVAGSSEAAEGHILDFEFFWSFESFVFVIVLILQLLLDFGVCEIFAQAAWKWAELGLPECAEGLVAGFQAL